MKKKIKVLIIIFLLSLFAYLGRNVIAKMQHKNDVAKTLETIQEFSFKTLQNVDFTNANLKTNAPTIFIYFNSECDFCQHEAQSISENILSFKDTQILFVSTENNEIIKEFANKYNLLNQPNIVFLHDNTRTFSTRFDANSIPFLLVYNKKQVLVKKHKGQLKAKALLKFLE